MAAIESRAVGGGEDKLGARDGQAIFRIKVMSDEQPSSDRYRPFRRGGSSPLRVRRRKLNGGSMTYSAVGATSPKSGQ